MGATETIRAVLVDNEVVGRLAIRLALEAHPDVEVVAECSSASEAGRVLTMVKPTLIFLDGSVATGEVSLFLRKLDPDTRPMVVLAAARDQHALQGVNAGALDYVLKPIEQRQFDRMMTRVRQRARELLGYGSEAFPEVPGRGSRWLTRVSVNVGEHMRILATEEIDWIEANGNYVHLHVGGVSYTYRAALRQLHDRLDPARFLRIHRATVVNVERVRELHPLFGGNAELVLKDGSHVRLSRRYRAQARKALGQL